MNVYMDDARSGPISYTDDDFDEWVIVRSVNNVKTLLGLNVVDDLSLDYDMGEGMPTGMDLAKWIVEHNTWPKGIITIHSSDPVGAENMKSLIDQHRPNE